MYKLVLKTDERQTETVVRLQDNAFIPFDPSNTDYQEYLAWIEAGNAPLPPTQEN